MKGLRHIGHINNTVIHMQENEQLRVFTSAENCYLTVHNDEEGDLLSITSIKKENHEK